jgi:Vitamin K-dependent gamma-carboxylase
VRRLSAGWNAYWFPPASTLHLAVCRIIAVGAQLFWFYPDLGEHVNLLRKNPEFIEPQLITRILVTALPREALFTPSSFTVLYWAIFGVGLAALVGLLTRLSLFLFAAGTWILVAHLFSYGDRHHTEALFAIFLLLLAFAPAGERLSVDALVRRWKGLRPAETSELAIWPLKVVHVLLGFTYFSAGAAKMIHSGFQWMNGYTLQGHTLTDALLRGHPVGIWLAQQHTLAVILSVFTILFELLFWVSLLLPRRWVPAFMLVALMFQVGLYVSGGYDFFQHMVLLVLLLLFLEPDWWRRWIARAPWPASGEARARA